MANLTLEQNNLLMRQRLIATGLHQDIDLGTFNLPLGASTRIKIQNIGITHRLRLLFKVNATIAGATASQSPHGILNAIPRISVIDFDAMPRINASASHIWMRNCLRERRVDGWASSVVNGFGSNYPLPGANAPGFNALTVGDRIGTFLLDVPLAVDSDYGDLRGALLTQSTVGEVTLAIDTVTLTGLFGNGDDTKVFNNTATISAASISVQVIQEYILPQQDPMIGGVPLPQMDLMTINELVSQTTSDNLAAGQDKKIALPNTRLVRGIYYRYFHNSIAGGVGNTNDIGAHSIEINGNNPVRKHTREMRYLIQRQETGHDMAKGYYFHDFIGLAASGRQPVQTAQLGNVQLVVKPDSSPVGNTYLDYAVESLHMKGVALGSVIPN